MAIFCNSILRDMVQQEMADCWRKKLAMSICPACRKGAVETCERDGITNAVRASVGRSAVACPIQTCLERSVDFDINRNALRH